MNDLAAEESLVLARRLAPIVSVPGSTGQYKEFNDEQAFIIYNTARAMGGDPERIEFKASDATYSCKPQALEVTVDEEERNQVGTDNTLGQQLLDQGKINALLNATNRSHAKKIVDYVVANTTAVADRGNWNNPAIDPIDQMDEQLDALSLAVGSTTNIKVDMDVSAWRAVRSHPKVKERCKSVQVSTITRQQFVDSLLFPVDFNVCSIPYSNTKPGATLSKARLLAATCLIHFSAPNPTQYDPSAFKLFTVGMGGPVKSVRSWSAPNGLYEGHFLDWSEDIKQTSSIAIKRLTITLPS